MENQHRKITGYRELSQEEIDLMNQIKAIGSKLDELVTEVFAHLAVQRDDANAKNDEAEIHRITASEASRWVSIARTDFQTGLMALTRAVAQPTTF